MKTSIIGKIVLVDGVMFVQNKDESTLSLLTRLWFLGDNDVILQLRVNRVDILHIHGVLKVDDEAGIATIDDFDLMVYFNEFNDGDKIVLVVSDQGN